MPAYRKDYDDAVVMYGNGFSIRAVAAKYGVSRNSMYKVLKRRNVPFRANYRFGENNHFFRGGSVADDRAQHALERALKSGEIIRPECCQKCGSSGKFADGRTAIQGHHADYNSPLDVTWLCQECHHEWHRRNRPIARRGHE